MQQHNLNAKRPVNDPEKFMPLEREPHRTEKWKALPKWAHKRGKEVIYG